MPTVSIIVPTYNRAAYILEALDSVFVQTYSDYEIIVVDDGSTDNTAEVLKTLVDQDKIHYVHQENGGESAARNHGIRLAQGKYIAFLDSDDLFLPSKLEKQVTFLDDHPDIGFVQSWYSKFNDAGEQLGVRNTSIFSGWVYPKILLFWAVLMAVPCVLVRREVLAEIGGFDENQYWGPDLDLWRRITKKHPVGVIPEVLSKIRVHPGNLSANKLDAVKWFERYLQKSFDDDPNLGWVFCRRVWSKMYCNVGDNVLSSVNSLDMERVRKFYLLSIRFWPFQLKAYLGFAGSILPSKVRAGMHEVWLNIRYKS